MSAIKRVGTPEILKEIENVVVLNNETVASFEKLRKGIGQALPRMESRIGRAIAEQSESLKSSDAATQKQISEYVGGLNQRIEQQGKTIKLMIGIGLPLVTVVIAVVLFLLKSN